MSYLKFFLFLIFLTFSGCGNNPPAIPTEENCTRSPASDNCGLCASRPICAWCATIDTEFRGCYPRSMIRCPRGGVIDFSDDCNAYAPDEIGLSE